MRKTEKQKRMPAEKRRIQIMEEMLELAAKKGLDGTKTRDIAAACGISEAAVFKLFRSKHEIFMAGLEYKFGGAKRELIKKINFDPERPEIALKVFANDMFEIMEKNESLAKVMILTIIEHPEYIMRHIRKSAIQERKIIVNAVKAGITSGLYKKLDLETVATLVPIALIGTIVTRLIIRGKKPGKKERQRIIDDLIEVYLHGVMKNRGGNR